jgi:formyltetrahydrofolate synthetase
VRLDVDPSTITWHRVLDTCDRFLRGIKIGEGREEVPLPYRPITLPAYNLTGL